MLTLYIGKIHIAQSNIQLITHKDNKGIIRINNIYDHHLRAAFCMLEEVENKKIIVRSLLSTGILEKAKKVM